MKLKALGLALCCATTVLLSACNDDNDKHHSLLPSKPIYYLNETTYNKDQVQAADRIQVMHYKMQGVNNRLVDTTALVMYPKGDRPKGGWKVVVWAHGTVGSADACAPSNNTLHERVKPLVERLLEKGYVVVAPDYEGLGVKGVHPYLHLKSAANSAIYAIKAFSEKHGKGFEGSWVSVGQSQGGHASLGIAEYADDLGPQFKGAVAAAPASSLGYIIGTIAPEALKQLVLGEAAGVMPEGSARAVYSELLSYAAYVAIGIKAYEPDFAYQDIFMGSSKNIAPKAEGRTGDDGLCLGELMTAFSQDIDIYLTTNKDKTVADYPGLIPKFDEHPSVAKFLLENQPGTKKINVPVMIIQGERDMAVPLAVTTKLADDLSLLGTTVDFQMVKGASHTSAIVERQDKLIDFIEKHLPISGQK